MYLLILFSLEFKSETVKIYVNKCNFNDRSLAFKIFFRNGLENSILRIRRKCIQPFQTPNRSFSNFETNQNFSKCSFDCLTSKNHSLQKYDCAKSKFSRYFGATCILSMFDRWELNWISARYIFAIFSGVCVCFLLRFWIWWLGRILRQSPHWSVKKNINRCVGLLMFQLPI